MGSLYTLISCSVGFKPNRLAEGAPQVHRFAAGEQQLHPSCRNSSWLQNLPRARSTRPGCHCQQPGASTSHASRPTPPEPSSVEPAPANSRRHSWPLPARQHHPLPAGTHSRGVGAELALQGVAVVRWDLGLGDQLRHLLSDAARQVPHVAIPLRPDSGVCGRAGGRATTPEQPGPSTPHHSTARLRAKPARADRLPRTALARGRRSSPSC